MFSGIAILLIFIVMALVPSALTAADPEATRASRALRGPSSDAWLGTDQLGRDVFSRVVHGARASLGIAAASIVLASTVGAVVGLASGYFGGAVDLVLGRLMDLLFTLPVLLSSIVVAGLLGPGVTNTILTMAVVYTPLFSRIARASTLAERPKEYVVAARVLGCGHARTLLRHVAPGIASPLIVIASAELGGAILVESSLSFLGLGVQPPRPSWGSMVGQAGIYMELAPWIVLFPGLAIALIVVACNLVGDGLRDWVNPQLR
jgi:peptide/nickel transport system permease protein